MHVPIQWIPLLYRIAMRLPQLLLVALLATFAVPAVAGHRFITQGKGKLAIVAADGTIEWEMPWGGIHDIHVRPDGHILVQRGAAEVVEIDPATKQVVWSYNAAKSGGNAGKAVEVHAFQPLPEDRLMIAESGPARIIEIDRAGAIQTTVPLKVEHPHPHTDTRLARKLADGHYLVCHEGDGTVREYSAAGTVVWEYLVPLFDREPAGGHGPEAYGNKAFSAVRLKNGNTLIATGNGHSLIEVTPDKEVVWRIGQHDLPGIVLAWVTTVEVLPDGHIVFGNCHAGPGQPTLIEIDRSTKQVVWSFDGYDTFGNDVSNSQLLDVQTMR